MAATLAVGAVLGGTSAASAETTDLPDSFTTFVDSLGTSADTAAALEDRFESLPEDEQAAVLGAVESEPWSLIEFTPADHTVTPVGPASKASLLTAYVVSDSQTASFLGIPLGNFTSEYKYEATTTHVTRALSCTGWFTGFGSTSVTNPFDYITSTGRGTCEVFYNMSFVFQGSPMTYVKLHNITTNLNDPTTAVITLKTV